MSASDAAPRRAKLRLIGAFRLTGVKGEVISIVSRRARGLLAYLALAPDQTATRERLCGLLWGDRGEPQARSSLRQCLFDLRETFLAAELGLLDHGREEIALRADALEIDIVDLKRALELGDVTALSEALGRAGAERLLGDLEIGGLFREWLEQTRTQFDRLLAQGVLHRLMHLEGDRRWQEARHLAEAFLQRDPLDEAVVAAAIRADVATGNTSAAHRRFKILQADLAKEFGVSPGVATREALAGARASEPVKPPSPVAAVIVPPLVVVAMFETTETAGPEGRLASELRDEVVSGLTRFRDLRVMTDPRGLGQIGEEAAVEHPGVYALGASLRPSKEGRRLLVQLVRTGDRRVIWSDRFSLPGISIFEATDDIIAQVVGAVLPSITADLVNRPRLPDRDSAYQRFLHARDAAFTAQSLEAAQHAAAELETLISDQPTFAPPYLALAYLYNTDFGYTRALSSGPKERARAFQLSKSALALDRGQANSYTSSGWCYLRARQFAVAEEHFQQAITINDFDANRTMEAAFGFVFLGNIEKARNLLDRCLLLNPVPFDNFFIDLGLLEYVRESHERAASYFELIAKPNIWCVIYAAMNAQKTGRAPQEQAAGAVAAISAIWPKDVAMETERVVAWISANNPFRDPDVEALFLNSARLMINGV